MLETKASSIKIDDKFTEFESNLKAENVHLYNQLIYEFKEKEDHQKIIASIDNEFWNKGHAGILSKI